MLSITTIKICWEFACVHLEKTLNVIFYVAGGSSRSFTCLQDPYTKLYSAPHSFTKHGFCERVGCRIQVGQAMPKVN